jgi:hypothetical protein
MASDELPQPESRGALVPPGRHPPTAVGTGTPEPPPPPARPPSQTRHMHVERTVHIGPDLKAVLNKVLDAIDQVAETIALQLAIRPASGRPSSSEPPAP